MRVDKSLQESVIIKIKRDYIAGINRDGEIVYPSVSNLAKKYKISEPNIYDIKNNDGDDWDKMRRSFMDLGMERAFEKIALEQCKELEEIYECLFLSLLGLYKQGLDDITNGKIKIRTPKEFLDLVSEITSLKEKKAGRDPLSMYDQRIRDIWANLAVDTEDIAEKVADKLKINDGEYEVIEDDI